MKKLTYLFMAFLLVFLAACSSNEATSKEENAETRKEEKKKVQGVAETKAKAEAEAKAKEEAEAKAKAEAEASSTTSSGGSEDLANCTDLRKVYPNGVPADHPAYQSKMDRDKDNYACEN
jgi:membrane protein involved in colicin uptake